MRPIRSDLHRLLRSALTLVPQISRMNTDFFDLCGQIYADFSTPLSPSCEEGSLSHSQALALSIRARDVAGGAIALPDFWSASGACAFVLKSSFNSLYTPFGSPVWGQKPQGRRGKPPYSVLEPLRFIVGGASKPCAMLCGMGPLGVERRFANI